MDTGFANISPIFLISYQTKYSKTLKYSEQYIRDHLSGTNTAWKIVLQKFVKRTVKVIFSLVFVCFRFKEISYFLNFPSNENVRKQHLYANAYSCVNMKFLYAIAVRKDEISCHFVTKTIVFHLRIGQLFVDDIYAKRWNLLRRIAAKITHWSNFGWRCLYSFPMIL